MIRDYRQAYQLKLLSKYQIYNIFHVSLLEPWRERDGIETEPTSVQVADQIEYEVKSIQTYKDTRRGRRYLVRWKGYSPAHDTWEPESNLRNAQEAVQDYLKT